MRMNSITSILIVGRIKTARSCIENRIAGDRATGAFVVPGRSRRCGAFMNLNFPWKRLPLPIGLVLLHAGIAIRGFFQRWDRFVYNAAGCIGRACPLHGQGDALSAIAGRRRDSA